MAMMFFVPSEGGSSSSGSSTTTEYVGRGTRSTTISGKTPSGSTGVDLSDLHKPAKVVNELADALTSVGAPRSNNTGKTVQETSQSLPGTSDPASSSVSTPYELDTGMNSFMQQLIDLAQSNTAKEQEFAQQQMDFQREQNSAAMAFNAEQAQINRDWQEMMANTAHQREVADMIAAGINPVLSVTGGNGATVTSGATASGPTSAGSKGNVDTGVTSALASMFGALINAQSMENVARISANSAANVAGINAGSAMAVQNSRNEQERYIYQHYPSNIYAYTNSILDQTNDDSIISRIIKKFTK